MSDLFFQLGIDWRLLISQGVNFLLLLVLLRVFAYRPLLKIMRERREKIQEGLDKTKEADLRLKEVDSVLGQKRKEAEQEALKLFADAEARAKAVESKLLAAAHEKETAVLKNADLIIQAKAAETKQRIEKEAAAMIKAAIAKTVELDPETIDETLIRKALAGASKDTQ